MQNKPVLGINEYGTKFWYLHGEYHREDGPAVEYTDGGKCWCLHGDRHREDGPAVEFSDGDKEWWLHGERHRTDGPAIEYASGRKEWFFNGKEYDFGEWLELTPLSEKEKVKLRLKYAK